MFVKRESSPRKRIQTNTKHIYYICIWNRQQRNNKCYVGSSWADYSWIKSIGELKFNPTASVSNLPIKTELHVTCKRGRGNVWCNMLNNENYLTSPTSYDSSLFLTPVFQKVKLQMQTDMFVQNRSALELFVVHRLQDNPYSGTISHDHIHDFRNISVFNGQIV
jgi:hypothetical protein